MLHRALSVLILLAAFAACLPATRAAAQDQGIRDLLAGLPDAGYDEKEEIISRLAATGEPAVAPVLRALGDGDLYARETDGLIFRAVKGGEGYIMHDPLTDEVLGEVGRRDADRIRVNNSVRRAVNSALASLTLRSRDARVRIAAADQIFGRPEEDALGPLEDAIAAETNDTVLAHMKRARAAIILEHSDDEAKLTRAIDDVAASGDRDALGLLMNVAARSEGAVRERAQTAVSRVEESIAIWNAVQNVWYGVSLGSILLLAAIGLAITFGVMGVINMAHGEMVMIGAYTTFAVQQVIGAYVPGLAEASVVIAVPLAFLVAGAIGVAIERSIIRFLYGRPLETLLATWGLSLILQQAVRSIFGPTNRQVVTPSWMSGSFPLGGLDLTYNRVVIVFFALAVFAVLVGLLRYSSFGLRLRAVMQNRRMAASMGIRTPWVDAMTFGLGSGIAGIGGVALSQIDNVSPNLGQGYIIDSFMVVVFGGVGNLWGTLVGALTLGVANKFLEPYAGAVLAKILVLVFIILFIQKRPRGLFAQKGRAVEA